MSASPYAAFLNLSEEVNADGRKVAVLNPGETCYAREGVMHGGATGALLEYAARLAVLDALRQKGNGEKPPSLATVSMTVDYLRPGPMSPNRALGRIVKLGQRVAHVNVDAWNADPGKLFATGKITIGIQQ